LDINGAILSALRGRSALFTGSGFSVGATNINGNPLPQGRELSKVLSDAVTLEWDASLEEAAEEFLRVKGEDELIVFLRGLYTTKSVGASHRLLATIPWRRLYTTNYDDVFEKACSESEVACTPATPSERPNRFPAGQLICVHLNGFIQRLNSDTLLSDFRLSDSSYLASSLEGSPWIYSLQTDLKYSDSFFFIGYSLYDLDIKRVLFQMSELAERCFFITEERPAPALTARLSRFGHICPIGIDGFGSAVAEAKAEFNPDSYPAYVPSMLTECSAPSRDANLTDQKLMNLLLNGIVDRALVAESIASGTPYYLNRGQADSVMRSIEDGTTCVAIISELGNGKTLFLEGLRLKAIQKGYRVFDLPEYSDDVSEELMQLAGLEQKRILIIENYYGRLAEIKRLRARPDRDTVLVLTARTQIHDVTVDRLEECLDTEPFIEICIDELDLSDLQWVVSILNAYGLWGDLASRSNAWKIRYLSDSCEAEFHGILLKLLESPNIVRSLRESFRTLGSSQERDRLAISILVLNTLGYSPSIETLCDIWGIGSLNRASLRKDPVLASILDLSRGTIIARSSVTSEYVLTRLATSSLTVSVLKDMSKSLNTLSSGTYRYRRMLGGLMRFTSLQQILPSAGRLTSVLEYYECLKTFEYCSKNPLFWLQYAIACLACENLTRAGKYFSTAYAYADPINFDTYQIDNHYCRYLLLKAIRNAPDTTEAMKDFRHAHRILSEQMHKEKLRYPYRVAAKYLDFAAAFRNRLSVAEVDELSEAAKFVMQRASCLPPQRAGARDVRICVRAMEKILELLEA
jgi:hypothetical protein